MPSAPDPNFRPIQVWENIGVNGRFFVVGLSRFQRTRPDFVYRRQTDLIWFFIGVLFDAHHPIFLTELLGQNP